MSYQKELVGCWFDLLKICFRWLMPVFGVMNFLTEVNQKFPGIVKILLTRQADDAAIQRKLARNADIQPLSGKPWNPEELLKPLAAVLHYWSKRG